MSQESYMYYVLYTIILLYMKILEKGFRESQALFEVSCDRIDWIDLDHDLYMMYMFLCSA